MDIDGQKALAEPERINDILKAVVSNQALMYLEIMKIKKSLKEKK